MKYGNVSKLLTIALRSEDSDQIPVLFYHGEQQVSVLPSLSEAVFRIIACVRLSVLSKKLLLLITSMGNPVCALDKLTV